MATSKSSRTLQSAKPLLPLLLLAAVISGCNASGADNAGTSESGTVVEKPTAKTEARAFLKISILQDKTLSTGRTRTPQMDQAQLDTAIKLISEFGGEISFGLVNANSNQSFLRLRIEIPPTAPKKPNQEGNPWEIDKNMRDYDELRQQYDKDFGVWKNKSASEIETFKSKVAPLLGSPADAGRTDVFGALQRASLFLSEREPSITAPVRAYVILISDGEDNVRNQYNPLPADTQLLLINGSASLGPMAKLEPERLESIDAALRLINDSERPKYKVAVVQQTL